MPPIFWVQRQDIGPSPRADFGMAFDAARGRIVVFGGDPGGAPLGDTWSWEGSLWTQVADMGPSPRHGHSVTDFPATQRLVLFGGAAGAGLRADTWNFDGTDWIQVADTGASPRAGHGVANDAARNVLVLFGGDSGGLLRGDTWVWNGQEWTQVQDVGPSPRRGHAMAFDPSRNQVVLFGGADATGAGLNDTWAWDGTAWTQVADTGPEPRVGASLAGGPSLLLFGGVNSIDATLAAASRVVYGDTWQWDAQGWSKVQDIGPAPRYGHTAAVRTDAGRLALFGGASEFAGSGTAALIPGLRNDTWEVPVGAGGSTAQPQILSVMVNPPTVTVPAAAGMVMATVQVDLSGPPPAGSGLQVQFALNQGGTLNYLNQGFLVPNVTFDGQQSTVTFNLVADGTPLTLGEYVVIPSYGPQSGIVGTFSVV